MRATECTELLRYELSEDELRQKSKDLARAVQVLRTAEEDKKAAVAQFAERIQTQTEQIGKLSREIDSGWEMRAVECCIKYHSPFEGMKTKIRIDTGAVVDERKMTADEMQEDLFQSDVTESPNGIN